MARVVQGSRSWGDYQDYEVGGERNAGFMRMLQFDIAAGEVKVNTYFTKVR